MRALVYHGPGSKAWEEVPDPTLQADTDAIVRVDAVTICGTDLHILKGDVPAVTDGRILGHAQRIFQRQRDHARAQTDAPRARSHMGQEDEGRRQAAFVFVEVVLRDPGRVEAVGLGVGDLLGHEAVALAGRRVVEQAAEKAQARAGGRGLRRGGGQSRCSFYREWRP